MKNIKKASMLLLSILIIVAIANTSLASSIQPRNITTENESTNNSATKNDTENEAENETENETENEVENNTASNNLITSNNTSGNVSQINTTNSSENIPHTGNENTYVNFAFLLLLAVVLGVFSFVQYNKITKKEN